MKRICYVTTISATLKAFVIDTAKYLHENGGYDVSFICDYDKEFAESLPEYIHYYPVSMKRGISIAGIKAMLEIKKILNREKFDIVQYSTPNASCYTAIAAALAHVSVRLYCQWGIAYVGFSGIKRKIFKLEEKMVCKLSTWIEPDSFGNLSFSHDEKLYPPEKGSVIWNGSASGVNTNKFNIKNKASYRNEIREKYNIPAKAIVFIFVGRVTRDKGINELFTVAKKLFEEHGDAYLLMVGPNENAGSVDASLYDWSVKNERVIYCGFTNEVEKYIAASDVYVLPSYREGFGSAVIEAEVMGLPVIVSDIPGPTDAMKKDCTGLVVAKANVKELADAMSTLYEDSGLRESYGSAAYEFAVADFEQSQLLEKILADRDRLLGKEEENYKMSKCDLLLPTMATCHEDIDTNEAKKILIAGQNSYIAVSFQKYMSQFENYKIDLFSTRSDEWKNIDFSQYDVVIDAAGVAHINETDENRELYYKVNRDLALEIAKKAKNEGVPLFLYISSMSVYGAVGEKVDLDTPLVPNNAYGKSKLEAEQLLWELNSEDFVVSLIRPPMVYGEGCKGNYHLLLKNFALKYRFFPNYPNERSMVYVDVLSAAIRGIIHNAEPGVYCPQDLEYIQTYEMIKNITERNGKRFRTTKLLNPFIKLAMKKVGIVKKAFGSLTYDKAMNVPRSWIEGVSVEGYKGV